MFIIAAKNFRFKYTSDKDLYKLVYLVKSRVDHSIKKYNLNPYKVNILLLFKQENNNTIAQWYKEDIISRDRRYIY